MRLVLFTLFNLQGTFVAYAATALRFRRRAKPSGENCVPLLRRSSFDADPFHWARHRVLNYAGVTEDLLKLLLLPLIFKSSTFFAFLLPCFFSSFYSVFKVL